MPCKTISYNASKLPNGSVCASSQGGYIAVSVTRNAESADFPFKVYLDMYDTTTKEWVQLGWRTGKASLSGTHVTFNPNYSTVRTFRVRCTPYPDFSTKYTVTTASFTHVG